MGATSLLGRDAGKLPFLHSRSARPSNHFRSRLLWFVVSVCTPLSLRLFFRTAYLISTLFFSLGCACPLLFPTLVYFSLFYFFEGT